VTTMIIGRAGQGLAGGGMIPTAMTIIATRLPRHQQPIGTSLFGVTAILGPVVGPLLGGWLTEEFSWHYAFLINVPICAFLVILLLVGLPNEKMRPELLKDADWLGLVGLSVGLGCMTVVLEEGNREQWFSSSLIIKLTVVSAIGYAMMLVGQFRAKSPIIRLALLFDRQFGAVVVMAVMLGMMMMFLAPLMMRYLDIRFAVIAGLLILSLSCWIDTALTANSVGGDFVDSQLLRGVGTVMAFLFLNQAAISSVPPQYAGDASGLFNAARNIGGSLALAAIATVQEQRLWFHSRRIEETMQANSVAVQEHVSGMAQMLGGPEAALRAISGSITRDALVMTYNDMFWLLAVGILIVTPLVLLLKPLPKDISAAPAH